MWAHHDEQGWTPLSSPAIQPPNIRSKCPSWAVVSWQGAPWFNMSKQFSPKSSIKLTWAYKYNWKPKEGWENYAGPVIANLTICQSGSYLHSCCICQNLPVRSLFHLFSLFCLSDSHSLPTDTRENVVCCLFVDGTSAWQGLIWGNQGCQEKGEVNGTIWLKLFLDMFFCR